MKSFNKLNEKFIITIVFICFLAFILIVIFVLDMFIFSTILISAKTSTFNPVKFTQSFSKYIDLKKDEIFIKENGTNELCKHNAWIQIIDDNLKETFSLNKPTKIPSKYNPILLLNSHKYDIENYSIFIGEKQCNNSDLYYIIGFPIDQVAKYNIEYSPSKVRQFLEGGGFTVIFLNFLILIVIFYLALGRKIAKPLENIIEAIKLLSLENYDKYYYEVGIYKNVFSNINKLSYTLKENKKRKHELDQMRDTWISSISHDIKTPLSSIKGYAEIIKDTSYKFTYEEIQEYANIMWEKSNYIQSLIEDLNLTYKLKNKLFSINKDCINLVDLLKNSIIEILNNQLYFNRNINFSPSNNSITISGDEKLLKRAFMNIILNSIIHNNSNVSIDVIVYKTDKTIVIIKDNGKGIEKEDINHIFEKYYIGKNTSFPKEASGLGLAIVKQIINAHDGNIYIDSEINKGTEIKIIL